MSEIEEEKYVEMPFQSFEFMGYTETQLRDMIQAYKENGQDQLIEKIGVQARKIADLEAALEKISIQPYIGDAVRIAREAIKSSTGGK